jgi:hypothetical protein
MVNLAFAIYWKAHIKDTKIVVEYRQPKEVVKSKIPYWLGEV